MSAKDTNQPNAKNSAYTLEEALKITDDILKLSKDNKYHPGAFIHGLIITLEYLQLTFSIPPKQLAAIKRDCRTYLKNVSKEK